MSLPLTAMPYVMYFRFSGDVIFSYNAGNPRNKDDTHVSHSSPGGCTGSEVCLLQLHLIFAKIHCLFDNAKFIK